MVFTDKPDLPPYYSAGDRFHEREFEFLNEHHFEFEFLNEQHFGDLGERVCIHLKRPRRNRKITIQEGNEISFDGAKDVSYHEMDTQDQQQHTVVGTTKNNKVRIHTGPLHRPTPYSSVGYRNQLKVSTLSCKKKPKYTYSTMDLREIFTSESEVEFPVPEKNHEPVKVQCVLQQKKKGVYTRFKQGDFNNKKLKGLKCQLGKAEDTTCQLIRTKLPPEVQDCILRYMNYDQVSWKADNNESFARSLADKRYKIDANDKNKFPDLASLLPAIKRESVKEMRITENEDLWVVSFGEFKHHGMARRYAVKPGTYKWNMISAMTSMRIDSRRSVCEGCTDKLIELQNAMADNQLKTMKGVAQIKLFSLEGSEGEPIDPAYTSPFYRGQDVTHERNYDYQIHMWVGDLDNRWLQDVQVGSASLKLNDYDGLKLNEYSALSNYKTMLFKDPIKFFGTFKTVEYVDESILALVSKSTGEVLGYLVDDEEFRFRVLLDERKIVGLNFLPPSLFREMKAVNGLVTHIRKHEVDTEMYSCLERSRSLRASLLNPLNNMVSIQSELDSTLLKIRDLERLKWYDYKLDCTRLFQERIDPDTVHIHETYREDFDFCILYSFNKLDESGTLDVIQRNKRLMFNRCSYEKISDMTICSLKVINMDALRSAYAVIRLKEKTKSKPIPVNVNPI